jgi:hypothetical protein
MEPAAPTEAGRAGDAPGARERVPLAASRSVAAPAGAPGGSGVAAWSARSTHRAPRAGGGGSRLRRIATSAALVMLLPAVASFAVTMLKASNSSFSIRSVEWMRDHGAAGFVSKIESVYYTLNAPAKGGPGLRALPRVGAGLNAVAGAAGARAAEYRPPNITPLTPDPLRGEGVWVPTRRGVSDSPILVTTFRGEPAEYPRLVAGVAWIDPARTTITLYPGREEPSVEMPSRGPMEVPPQLRSRLLATFNSGFKLSDSGGGFASGGHTYAPLRAGQATFVRYRDGRVDVIAWHGPPDAGPEVVFARQNLPLIVENGRPNPALNESAEWGATLGNAVRVWRSGIGVDRHGNLIYAAANDQTVVSLAHILMHAGAVRAMELDINSYWVTFNSYGAPGARQPQKLLSEMERPATRYLEADDRDFFAVFER